MFIALILLTAIAAGGMALTYLVAEDESFFGAYRLGALSGRPSSVRWVSLPLVFWGLRRQRF